MKFAVYKEKYNFDKNSIVLCNSEEYSTYLERKIKIQYQLFVLIQVTFDFNLSDEFIEIKTINDSIQFRPKKLHKNNKGIYYKDTNNKIKYLTGNEIKELNEFILYNNIIIN